MGVDFLRAVLECLSIFVLVMLALDFAELSRLHCCLSCWKLSLFVLTCCREGTSLFALRTDYLVDDGSMVEC